MPKTKLVFAIYANGERVWKDRTHPSMHEALDYAHSVFILHHVSTKHLEIKRIRVPA